MACFDYQIVANARKTHMTFAPHALLTTTKSVAGENTTRKIGHCTMQIMGCLV